MKSFDVVLCSFHIEFEMEAIDLYSVRTERCCTVDTVRCIAHQLQNIQYARSKHADLSLHIVSGTKENVSIDKAGYWSFARE